MIYGFYCICYTPSSSTTCIPDISSLRKASSTSICAAVGLLRLILSQFLHGKRTRSRSSISCINLCRQPGSVDTNHRYTLTLTVCTQYHHTALSCAFQSVHDQHPSSMSYWHRFENAQSARTPLALLYNRQYYSGRTKNATRMHIWGVTTMPVPEGTILTPILRSVWHRSTIFLPC